MTHKKIYFIVIFSLLLLCPGLTKACIGVSNDSCEIIKNLNEFSGYYAININHHDDYYQKLHKGDIIIIEEDKCIKGNGEAYLIPNDIPLESLKINTQGGNYEIINEKQVGAIDIGYVHDHEMSCFGQKDEIKIFEISLNENGKNLSLTKHYKEIKKDGNDKDNEIFFILGVLSLSILEIIILIFRNIIKKIRAKKIK